MGLLLVALVSGCWCIRRRCCGLECMCSLAVVPRCACTSAFADCYCKRVLSTRVFVYSLVFVLMPARRAWFHSRTSCARVLALVLAFYAVYAHVHHMHAQRMRLHHSYSIYTIFDWCFNISEIAYTCQYYLVLLQHCSMHICVYIRTYTYTRLRTYTQAHLNEGALRMCRGSNTEYSKLSGVTGRCSSYPVES